MRTDRKTNELRDVQIITDFTKYAEGSVLCCFGDTKVICTAMAEERVPGWLKGSGSGWLSAEYSMIPSANAQRKARDISKLKLDGRSAEIQRLIGRSLRSCIDLEALGERTIWVDCDVIQADGGTRVTSITGGFVALYLAVQKLLEEKLLKTDPIKFFMAAVSVGIVEDELLCDLCYKEDSAAMLDMNVVMNERGEFIELQATAEGRCATKAEMSSLTEMAQDGIFEIIKKQKEALGVSK